MHAALCVCIAPDQQLGNGSSSSSSSSSSRCPLLTTWRHLCSQIHIIHTHCHADLDSGIPQYVYDPADIETGEEPVGTLTVIQTGTLVGVDFYDQGQLNTLFPDAESARVTGRTWVLLWLEGGWDAKARTLEGAKTAQAS